MFASTSADWVIIVGELLLHYIPPPIHGLEEAKETCDNIVLPSTEAHYPSKEAQNYATTTLLDSSDRDCCMYLNIFKTFFICRLVTSPFPHKFKKSLV